MPSEARGDASLLLAQRTSLAPSPMNAPTPPVKAGDIVAGKYRVDRILGMGGMGIVVAATHVELHEHRALKFLLPNALSNAEAVERFLREARAASRLKSEHVARVHDVGKLEDGAPYMVMEYLDGYDLGAAIKHYGAIALETSIFYVLQAMEALAEAHAAGIIHRDLKPANLFLTVTHDGIPCVKVLDFGISKISDAESQEIDMTKTHAVLGSPQFMSPEQMHSSRGVDVRADIWSLGVILYQLTTGKLPFRGRSVTEIVAMVLSGPPAPPSTLIPHLPAAFDAVVLRCLSLNREERYASIGELAVALTPFAPASAAYILERIARVAASFVRKSGGGMPAAPTSSPGSVRAPAPYAQMPSAPPPPASQAGYPAPPPRARMPSTVDLMVAPNAYGNAPNAYAQPTGMPTLAGIAASAPPNPPTMSSVPTAAATPLPVPHAANPTATPLPGMAPSSNPYGYTGTRLPTLTGAPPTGTSPLPMPSIPAGQIFLQQGAMPLGSATGAWGGTQATTQATSNPSTNRAIYVLSAVIALAVVVLVVLQFVSTGQKTTTAASASPLPPTKTVSTTDKPPPIVTATTTPPPPAVSSSADPPAPSATTKKKVIVDDPFGTQRR